MDEKQKYQSEDEVRAPQEYQADDEALKEMEKSPLTQNPNVSFGTTDLEKMAAQQTPTSPTPPNAPPMPTPTPMPPQRPLENSED